MKIKACEAIPIRIPLKKPFAIASGAITHTNHVLVRMIDDRGRTGWGEAITFHPVYGYDQRSLYQVLSDYLIPAVLGLDPRDLTGLHQAMDRAIPLNLMAKTGIDIAAHDLAARAAGLPIHLLIGGRRTTRVPQAGIVDIISEKEAVGAALALIDQGFKTIKLKIGLNAREDARRVRSVRRAIGDDIALRVDANAGYDRASALRALRPLDDAGLEWFEQPLPGRDLAGLVDLAGRLDTPIALDESIYTPEDAFAFCGAGAAGAVNIKVAKCGGIHRAVKIAAVCEAAGVPCFLGGCLETGVGTAAAAHFYAAASNLFSAAEILGAPFYLDDVVAEPFAAVDGAIELPEGPGLGVVVDWDKVEAYRFDY